MWLSSNTLQMAHFQPVIDKVGGCMAAGEDSSGHFPYGQGYHKPLESDHYRSSSKYIYTYNYYYDSGHFEMPHGCRQSKENAAGIARRHFAGGMWVSL